MKLFKYITYSIVLILILNGCTKSDYLDRYPLDQISTNQYWKHANDLKLYVNQFYNYTLPFFNDDHAYHSWTGGIFWFDDNSDNYLNQVFDARLAGTRTVPTSASGEAWKEILGTPTWNFKHIRDVNFFLANYKKCEDDFDQYKQYVGEAYFFRAYAYYGLVRSFGDVPWINKPLNVDSPELYAPRDPRNVVIDHILSDLDSAALLMQSGPNLGGTRLNQEAALLIKSRVALFEGTWEKYHASDPFGVSGSDGTKYLQIAVQAAETVMNSEHYGLFSTGHPESDYFNFFIQEDYSSNPEAIFWKKYDRNLNMQHWHNRMARGGTFGKGISRSLADAYLCTDGQPISVSPLFQGHDSLDVESMNRDPRFYQTIYCPGAPWRTEGNDTTVRFYKPGLNVPGFGYCQTGYQKRKGYDPDYTQWDIGNHSGTTGTVFFRFAEALLNYAEAKAELGTLTQGDVDKSINLLRDRVGMPHMDINNIPTDPEWHFPTLSPVINEIRRERRVELALEGYRWDDIARWAAADELIVNKNPEGVYFIQHYWEVTDPNKDIWAPWRFPLTPGDNVWLTDDNFVKVYANSLPNGWQFDVNRDYLSPIPTSELTLNENLTQNPGW